MSTWAAQHLQGLGWQGEGKGLREGSRARPVNAHQKKSAISGIGKETVSTFAWWETLYDNVASKKGSKLQTTSTGIISPHEQPASRAFSPPRTRNVDAIADAKLTAAKATLYAKFLRGPVLAPEPEPALAPEPAPAPEPIAGPSTESKEDRRSRKRARREAREAAAQAAEAPAPVETPIGADDERRERKRRRKEAQAAVDDEAEAKAKRKAERRRLKSEAKARAVQ